MSGRGMGKAKAWRFKKKNVFGKLQCIQKDCWLGTWMSGAGGSQKGILVTDLDYSP